MGHNEFLEQILSVLELLVAYGFFKHPTEIRNAIEALLGIIDGRTDKPFKGALCDVILFLIECFRCKG